VRRIKMADKLIKYYAYITKIKGFKGKIDLAKKTKLPSTKAALVPDDAEHINLFKSAIKEITGTEAPDY
jgi:hypothetical protein